MRKLLNTNLKGDGNIYVIFLLAAIMGISFFMVGGVIPVITNEATDYKVVQVDLAGDASKSALRSNLQMTTFTACKSTNNFQYVNQFSPKVAVRNSDYTRADGIGINSKGQIILSVQGKTLQIYDKDEKTLINKSDAELPSNGEHRPYEIAIGADDRIYVADQDSSEIRIYSPDGSKVINTITGSLVPRGFSTLRGIAVDKAGNIALTDAGNNRVVRFSNTGEYIGPPITSAGGISLNNPSGMHFDSKNDLYIADDGNNRLVKLNNDGTQTIEVIGTQGSGDNQFDQPDEVAIDASDNVFVTDVVNSRIMVFDNNLKQIAKFGKYGSGNGEFINPWSIDVNNNGRVFVSDTINGRVEIFDKLCGGENIITPTATPTKAPTPIPTSPPTPTKIAVTQPPNKCEAGELAVMLIVDKSGSMDSAVTINNVKRSLESFTNRMLQSSGNNLFSLMSFTDKASSDIPLNTVNANRNLISSIVDKYVPLKGSPTNLEPTFIHQQNFISQVDARGNDYKKVILIVSDGDFSNQGVTRDEEQAKRLKDRFIATAHQIRDMPEVDVYMAKIGGDLKSFTSIFAKAVPDLQYTTYVKFVNSQGSQLPQALDQIFTEVCR